MRNSTKLKTLLLKYTILLDITNDGMFKLLLTDKQTQKTELFEGESYGKVLSKAYSYLLKELKAPFNSYA
jgi:hypothetical protein